MQSKSYRAGTPLLDFLRPCTLLSAREFLKVARLCSHLAKLVTGPTRRKLYRLKDQNILAATFVDPSALLVDGDGQVYFGLLSVSLQADPTLRVHTHENWMAVA